MRALLQRPATGIWLILMFATGLSWWLGARATQDLAPGHAAAVALLVVAFIKVHLITDYFMEVHAAPAVLRLSIAAWTVGVCGTLIGLYINGPN